MHRVAAATALVVATLVMLAGGAGAAGASGNFPNDTYSYHFFVMHGLSAVQAAGIVGNLDQESGDSPTAVQSGGPGRGVAQWSVGGRWDTDHADNMVAYASSLPGNPSYWKLQPQLQFIWYELATYPSYGLSTLEKATTVTQATEDFMANFEICGACDASQRISYADTVDNDFLGTTYNIFNIANPSSCFDANRNDYPNNGDPIQLWSCNGNVNNEFTVSAVSGSGASLHFELESPSGLCIDANSHDYPNNGDNIHLWGPCNTNPNNVWTYTGVGQIKNASTNTCLDANRNHYPSNGDAIQLWACNTNPEQLWSVT